MALSSVGSTAIIGGLGDSDHVGAAWVWTRSGGVWTQQGSKLVGSDAKGLARQGWSAALSADGNTAIVGGFVDNGGAGATWVWTRSGGVWTQQGPKLVGSGAVGEAYQGWSVSLSADGNMALVGGIEDNRRAGATWVWKRSDGVWKQQPSKLVGSGAVGVADQGYSVSLSSDGNTALVGGPSDTGHTGAAWVFSAVPPPTIGNLSNVSTRVDTPIAVTVTVGGGANGPAGLTVSGRSSNPTLVPNANLVITGSGATRTLTIMPAANQTGTTTITVSASDGLQTVSTSFGVLVGTPIPSGDFDGDARTDITVFRPSNGTWYVVASRTGVAYGFAWGNSADKPVVGDFDGDHKTDIAVFRPSNGTWYIVPSTTGVAYGFAWGNSADIPILKRP